MRTFGLCLAWTIWFGVQPAWSQVHSSVLHLGDLAAGGSQEFSEASVTIVLAEEVCLLTPLRGVCRRPATSEQRMLGYSLEEFETAWGSLDALIPYVVGQDIDPGRLGAIILVRAGQRYVQFVVVVSSNDRDALAALNSFRRLVGADPLQGDEPVVDPRDYQRDSLPLPPVIAPVVGGVDLAIGRRWGASDALEDLVLTWGVHLGWSLSESFAANLRLGYLRVVDPGTDNHYWALQPSLGLRWENRNRGYRWRFFAETGAGARFAAGATDRAMAYGLVGVAAARWAWTLRYERALAQSAVLRDAAFVGIERRGSHWADRESKNAVGVGLGIHVLSGWSFADGLGIMPLGVSMEFPVYFGHSIMPTVTYDLLWFPGVDGPGGTLQNLMGGLQWLAHPNGRWSASVTAGYGFSAGRQGRQLGSGLVAGAELSRYMARPGWYLSLLTRQGLDSDTKNLRAVFLAIGGRQIFP